MAEIKKEQLVEEQEINTESGEGGVEGKTVDELEKPKEEWPAENPEDLPEEPAKQPEKLIDKPTIEGLEAALKTAKTEKPETIVNNLEKPKEEKMPEESSALKPETNEPSEEELKNADPFTSKIFEAIEKIKKDGEKHKILQEKKDIDGKKLHELLEKKSKEEKYIDDTEKLVAKLNEQIEQIKAGLKETKKELSELEDKYTGNASGNNPEDLKKAA